MKVKLLSFSFVILLFTNMNAQKSFGGEPVIVKNKYLAKTIPTINMPPISEEALIAEDEIKNAQKIGPWRFGYNHEVDYGIHNAGIWEMLDNGDRVWRMRINAPNAKCVSVVFDQFYLPEGGQVFIYNEDYTQQIGAFTDKNNDEKSHMLPTIPIRGDHLIVEYLEPVEKTGEGSLHIGTFTHGYKNLYERIDNKQKDLGDSGNCHFNSICPQGDDFRSQIKGAAQMLMPGSVCSGSLINNTLNDGTPYFLTAQHCTDGYNPNTLIFRFKWESPTCNPTNNGPTNKTISGSSIVAENGASDFALLLLNSTPPASYNVYYTGWNRSTTAASKGTCIHHPAGDIKKISLDHNSVSSSGNYWQVSWDEGVTEGGSSGSPLLGENGLIIGQLYGGNSSCSMPTAPDVYGKISTSWNNSTSSKRLKDWLDPNNSGVMTLNGFNPNSAVDIEKITENKMSFEIYPNPTNGSFTVDLSNINTNNVILNVFDLLGANVLSTQVKNTPIQEISLADMAEGIYTVEVVWNGSKTFQKIILTK